MKCSLVIFTSCLAPAATKAPQTLLATSSWPVRRVIDRIAPPARRATLEGDQLGNEAGVVEQLDAAGVQQGQRLEVDFALRTLARHVEIPCLRNGSRGHSPP